MTKDEALKLGIESLEWHNQHMHRKISEQAIAAMKEALAQPEQDWIERERAVGYREGHQNALKQMAQPEQEPVTWRYKIVDVFGRPAWTLKTPKSDTRVLESQPLYTTPPQRKPLTDEEILQTAHKRHARINNNIGNDLLLISFARAIEAAHGIKENT